VCVCVRAHPFFTLKMKLLPILFFVTKTVINPHTRINSRTFMSFALLLLDSMHCKDRNRMGTTERVVSSL
jgi:hypothetical protein